MTVDQNLIAFPLLESHVIPASDGQRVALALETIGGKIATTLTPLEAAAVAHDLLEWSSAARDPENLVLDSSPMTVEALAFEKSSTPGYVRLVLTLGASRLLFELPSDHLASAAVATLPKGPR